jgi:hypothetical protein
VLCWLSCRQYDLHLLDDQEQAVLGSMQVRASGRGCGSLAAQRTLICML